MFRPSRTNAERNGIKWLIEQCKEYRNGSFSVSLRGLEASPCAVRTQLPSPSPWAASSQCLHPCLPRGLSFILEKPNSFWSCHLAEACWSRAHVRGTEVVYELGESHRWSLQARMPSAITPTVRSSLVLGSTVPPSSHGPISHPALGGWRGGTVLFLATWCWFFFFFFMNKISDAGTNTVGRVFALLWPT